MRGADREGQGHRGQRGAKEGQRTQGIGGGIGGAMQRGHEGRAADAPQRHISATGAIPTPPVSTPPFAGRTYRYPAKPPLENFLVKSKPENALSDPHPTGVGTTLRLAMTG